MRFQVAPCVPADGVTAGALQAPSPPSHFLTLQLGRCSIETMRESLSYGYPYAIANALDCKPPTEAYLKVTNDNGEMIAWALWELPVENKQHGSGGLKMQAPRGMNQTFLGEVCRMWERMRERVLKGRKCFVLIQITTEPSYRRQGAGTLLVSWVFERADKEGVVCYLDTVGEGVSLYEKLGFVKVDECELDLEELGFGEGKLRHIAMVREPKIGDAKVEEGVRAAGGEVL